MNALGRLIYKLHVEMSLFCNRIPGILLPFFKAGYLFLVILNIYIYKGILYN